MCLSSLTRGEIAEKINLLFKVNDTQDKNYLNKQEFNQFVDDLLVEI